jgi:hypothetical protein
VSAAAGCCHVRASYCCFADSPQHGWQPLSLNLPHNHCMAVLSVQLLTAAAAAAAVTSLLVLLAAPCMGRTPHNAHCTAPHVHALIAAAAVT